VPRPVSRRAVVTGTCAVACGAAVGGCATYTTAGPEPEAAPPSGPPEGAAAPLARAADVPIGGGTVLADRDVVITQPVSGQFRAFSATCTHQGCAVGDVSDGAINCHCHGSRFALADGAVVDGPAETPLPEREVTVSGEDILLA
jgi:Rieske Fe-S protein